MRLGDTMIGGDVVVVAVARIHMPLDQLGQLLDIEPVSYTHLDVYKRQMVK